ncbi:MAG: hypothetical protein NW215_04050 [Hyphomicrobiales bacterium]|nr:hypothetical protein [Hyphomicrobiales bacterium]
MKPAVIAVTLASSGAPAGSALAETCNKAAFEAVVAEANAAINREADGNKRALQEKLSLIKTQQGWSEADFLANAAPFVRDEATQQFDARNKALLGEVAALGGDAAAAPEARCAMLDRLRALMANVVSNTAAKWRHMHMKADAALNPHRSHFATANSAK